MSTKTKAQLLAEIQDLQQRIADLETERTANLKESSKRFQLELNQYTKKLEKLVKERTKALEETNIKLLNKITERKKLEKALLKSKEYYQTLFTNLNDAIFIHDLSGKILDVNQMTIDRLGYSKVKLLTMAISDIDAPEDIHKVTKTLEVLKRDGKVTFEREHVCWDGRRVPVEINSCIFKYGGQKAVLSSARDITERKREEQDLLKLRTAVDTSGEVIFMTDREGVITFTNPEFTRLYGYAAAEVVGKTTARILKSGVMKPEDYAYFWQTLLNKQVVKGELINKTKDGRLLNIEGSANPILDDEGNIAGFLAIQHDITERKRTSQRYETILKTSIDSFWYCDAQGKILDVNDALCQMLGYDRKELLSMSVSDIEAVEKPEDTAEHIKKIKQQGSDRFYTRHKRKDGKIIDIEVSTNYLKIEDGQFFVFARDITERRKIEEDLKNAKQVADVANKAKSEFLANMSHELRTPLNAINGFSEVLLEKYFGDLNTKQEEYVRDILESGNHLLSLINDILDLSKVEAGKEVLELAQVDIKPLLENSLVMIKEKSMKHNIALEIEIPNNLTNFQIIADQRKLKQVMYNLLSNAAKFTPDGGKISVETLRQKKIIQVSVSDTGIGIPKEDQGEIFNEFYQVRNDQEAKQQGTGLGLSLVKRYIEMHGGRVWVESEGSGKGSKFSFTLPIKQNLQSK